MDALTFADMTTGPAGQSITLLIREGASIKAVQHHLDHKSASITPDRYGHLFPEELDHLADRLDGCTQTLLCTQRVPTLRWPPSGKAKGLVSDQALLVEVGDSNSTARLSSV